MSSFDLTGKKIRNTYQRLIQISGSNIVDGTGSLVDNITLTGSFTGSFIGSFADGIEVEGGSSLIKSTGFLGLTRAGLGDPSGFVIYSGSNSTTLGSDTLAGTGFKFVGSNADSYITFTDQNGGDLEIKTDKFNLSDNGIITASDALFDGTVIAQNFVQNSVVITGPDEVAGVEPNFNNYLRSVDEGYTLYLNSQYSGEIVNNVELRLSEPVIINDIVIDKDSTYAGIRSLVSVKVRTDSTSDSAAYFDISNYYGNSYRQRGTQGNVYVFEIDFPEGAGSKSISALSATDLSIPITASNSGINIKGDIYATNFYGTASYAEYAVSASHEIIKEVSSSFADTASYVNPLSQSVELSGSLSVTSVGGPADPGIYVYKPGNRSTINIDADAGKSATLNIQQGGTTQYYVGMPIQDVGSLGSRFAISYQGNPSFVVNGNSGIGIGLPAPTSRLHVRGSGITDSTTALRVENANASALFTILDNGKVGIGTDNPNYGLDLQFSENSTRNVNIKNGWQGTGVYLENSLSNRQTTLTLANNLANRLILVAGGSTSLHDVFGTDDVKDAGAISSDFDNGFKIGTENDAPLSFYQNSSQVVDINSSGVFITGSLTVSGSSTFTNIGPAVLSGSLTVADEDSTVPVNIIRNDNNSTLPVKITNNNASGRSGLTFSLPNNNNQSYSIGVDNDRNFKIGENNLGSNTRFVVTAAGNVALGPNASVISNASVSLNGTTIIQGETNNTFLYLKAKDLNYTTGLRAQNSNAASNWVLEGNNTGTTKLAVTTGDLSLETQAAKQIAFKTTNLERARITSTGNVGIGTTSPVGILHAYSTSAAVFESPSNAAIIIRRNDNVGYSSLLKYHSGNTEKFVAGLSDSGDYTGSTGEEYFIGTTKTNPLVVLKNDGKLGIGTTTPAYRLDVSGSGNFTDNISVPDIYLGNSIYHTGDTNTSFRFDNDQVRIFAANYTAFETTGYNGVVKIGATNNPQDIYLQNDAGVGLLLQKTTGKVGIGTTNPLAGLEVANAENSTLRLTRSSNNSNYLQLQGGSSGAIYNINTSGTQDHIFQTGGNEKMRLTSAGNVGIGTSSPTPTAGNMGVHIKAPTNVSSELKLDTTDSNRGNYITFAKAGVDKWDIYSPADGSLRFRDKTLPEVTTPLTLLDGGNIGINTTSPTALLEVKGSGSVSTDTHFRVVEAAGTGNLFRVNQRETIARFLTGSDGILLPTNQAVNYGSSTVYTKRDSTLNAFVYSQGGTEHFAIKDGGNVGIGTTNPEVKLSVAGGKIQLENNQEITWSDIGDGTTGRVAIRGSEDNDFILFRTDGGERMRLSGPNLGIGTTSPTEKLTVEGNISASGNIYIQGALLLDGVDGLRFNQGGSSVFSPTPGIFYSGTSGQGWYFQVPDNGQEKFSFKLGGTSAGREFRVVDPSWNPLFQVQGTGDAIIANNLTVGGTVTAQEFHTEFVSASIIYRSGSTKFGDTSDDIHQFTGSLELSGSAIINAATNTNSYFFAKFRNSDDEDVIQFRTNGSADFNGSLKVNSNNNLGRVTVNPTTDSSDAIGIDERGFIAFADGGTLNTRFRGLPGGVFQFQDDAYTTLFNISKNGITYLNISGNFGIGTTSPSEKLDVNGTVQATAFVETSARRFKENIEPIEGALDKVINLQGVTFNRIGEEKHEYGFIADEVKGIVPELVTHNAEGEIQGVHYARTVAILTEAIKELNNKVKAQDLFINDLVARIEKLENK